ncbi:MAG: glycosyltransferase family 39 protein [Chloroflexi bacterium]|nr:glycosyltransferase family 39 protein [Chloroflexota bacterium]
MIARYLPASVVCLLGAGLAGVLFAAFSGPFPLQEFCTRNRPTWVLGLFTTPRYTAVTGPVFLAALLALTGMYGASLWLAPRVQGRALWLLLLVGMPLGLAVLLLPAYPVLSNDIFKYVFDGRILAVYHENPFVKVPADYPDDRFYDLVYWKAVVNAHGPIWRVLEAVSAEVGGERCANAIMAMKVWPILAYLGTIGVLFGLLRTVAPERALAGALAYAWCPLVLFEALQNGHNDVVAALPMLLALWAALAGRWWIVPVLVALGFLVKPLAGLAAPVLLIAALRSGGRARRDIVLGAAPAAAIFLGAYAPFFVGLTTFQGMERSGIFSASPGELVVIALEGAGWPLDRAMSAARIVANGGFLLILGVALQALWRGTLNLPSALAASFFGYLLFGSQWFNPWYLLWLLPLALATPGWQIRGLALAFVLLAPLTYLLQYDARLVVPLVFLPVGMLAIWWRAALGWPLVARPGLSAGSSPGTAGRG